MKTFEENKWLIGLGVGLIAFTLVVIWLLGEKPISEEMSSIPEKSYLRNYQVNEVVPTVVDEEQMAKTYLAEYVSLIFNNPKLAYDMLDEEYRIKAYPTYESFTKYIKLLENDKFGQAALLKYEVKMDGDYKVYNLYDIANNNFIFRESSIMNYTVLLDNYTL